MRSPMFQDAWLFPDGTPISHTEAAAFRRYVTGDRCCSPFNPGLQPETATKPSPPSNTGIYIHIQFFYDISHANRPVLTPQTTQQHKSWSAEPAFRLHEVLVFKRTSQTVEARCDLRWRGLPTIIDHKDMTTLDNTNDNSNITTTTPARAKIVSTSSGSSVFFRR